MELNDYTILCAYVSSETKIIRRFTCGLMEESAHWVTKRPLAEQHSMFQWKQLLVLKLCHSKYFPGRCHTSTPQAKWLQTLWRFSMSVFWVCFWSNESPGRAMAAPQLYSKVREFKPRYFHIWAAETCATMNHPNCPILQHFSVGNFKLSNRIHLNLLLLNYQTISEYYSNKQWTYNTR